MIKCTRTERKFKVDFLENKASNEKCLFYIFDFFFRVESPPFRLYHQLPTTLYNTSYTTWYVRSITKYCYNYASNVTLDQTLEIDNQGHGVTINGRIDARRWLVSLKEQDGETVTQSTNRRGVIERRDSNAIDYPLASRRSNDPAIQNRLPLCLPSVCVRGAYKYKDFQSVFHSRTLPLGPFFYDFLSFAWISLGYQIHIIENIIKKM